MAIATTCLVGFLGIVNGYWLRSIPLRSYLYRRAVSTWQVPTRLPYLAFSRCDFISSALGALLLLIVSVLDGRRLYCFAKLYSLQCSSHHCYAPSSKPCPPVHYPRCGRRGLLVYGVATATTQISATPAAATLHYTTQCFYPSYVLRKLYIQNSQFYGVADATTQSCSNKDLSLCAPLRSSAYGCRPLVGSSVFHDAGFNPTFQILSKVAAS